MLRTSCSLRFGSHTGIGPVSLLHVTIGSSLDSMTSPHDFHLFSPRNVLAFLGIVSAITIPLIVRRIYRRDLRALDGNEDVAGAEVVVVAGDGVKVTRSTGYGAIEGLKGSSPGRWSWRRGQSAS